MSTSALNLKTNPWVVTNSSCSSHEGISNKEMDLFLKSIVESPELKQVFKRLKTEKEDVPFQLKIQGENVWINVNKGITPEGELHWIELSSVKNVAGTFYQRANECSEGYKEKFQKIHKERSLEEAAPRSTSAKVAEKISITSDAASAISNSIEAVAVASPVASLAAKVGAAALPVLGVARGGMFLYIGSRMIYNGVKQTQQSYQKKDVEGMVLNGSDVVSGSSFVGLGGVMAVSNTATLAATHAGKVIAAKASVAFSPLSFVLYGILGLYAAYGLGANLVFRKQLNKLESEQGLYESLKWLQNQVRGPHEEGLQKQWDKFARRTSADCCQKVRETLTPEFLNKLSPEFLKSFESKIANSKNEEEKKKAIEEYAKAQGELKDAQEIATQLVAQVKTANGRQLVKYTILSIIAVLGIIAVVGSIMMTGPFAPVLFVIGALLWFLVDCQKLHKATGEYFYPDVPVAADKTA